MFGYSSDVEEEIAGKDIKETEIESLGFNCNKITI